LNSKVCYISNFYFGERRVEVTPQKEDRLLYLKHQIITLSQYTHNLSKIIFNFNLREKDISYINEIIKLTPKQIQNTPVELIFRQNKGMSYGAWSDIFIKYQNEFDYYIFNEDDYFFIEPNWDQYLITKYTTTENCGYLCMMVRNPEWWNYYKKHAGHSSGIASTENLLKVYNKYGVIPHNDVHTKWKHGDDHSEYQKGENSQLIFSFAFIELGMNVLDISDDYKLNFNMTAPEDPDIWKMFHWNEKELITPAYLIFEPTHTWYMTSHDEYQFIPENIYSTVEEALKCYEDKINLKTLRSNKNL